MRNRTHKSLIIAKICAISLRDRPRIRKIEPVRGAQPPVPKTPTHSKFHSSIPWSLRRFTLFIERASKTFSIESSPSSIGKVPDASTKNRFLKKDLPSGRYVMFHQSILRLAKFSIVWSERRRFRFKPWFTFRSAGIRSRGHHRAMQTKENSGQRQDFFAVRSFPVQTQESLFLSKSSKAILRIVDTSRLGSDHSMAIYIASRFRSWP